MKKNKVISAIVLIVASVIMSLGMTACSAKKYTVTLDANGGQLPNNQTSVEVMLNKNYTLPTPTKPGYTFEGWMQDTDIIASTGKWTIESDISLVASWEERIYNITYDANGGEGLTVTTATIKWNEDLALPANLTKSGYNFAGWTLNGELIADPNEIISWNYDDDATLVAKWTAIGTQVTIDANGGQGLESEVVTAVKGEILQLPTLTKKGYSFVGWELNEQPFDITVAWNLDDSTATLVALWQVNTYTLTIDVNGGTALADNTMEIVFGQPFEIPTVTNGELTLVRWVISGTQTEFNDDEPWSLDENITIVAQWAGRTIVTVKYGITGVEDEQKDVVIGEEFDFSYERKGYTLIGYVLEGTNTEVQISGDNWAYTENKTIVAVWEAKTYNVTIKGYDETVLTTSPIVVRYDEIVNLIDYVPEDSIIVEGKQVNFKGFKVEGTDDIIDADSFDNYVWDYDSAVESITLIVTYGEDDWI